MKDISLAHADSYQELNKFDLIDATDVLSVARYNCDSNREPLQPYLHKHSQYEFIIPIKTIHLIEYMNCKFIGEVGFCYPFESNEPHGFDHEMNKANFVSVVIDYDFYQSRLKEFHRAGMVFNNRFPVKKALVSLLKNFQDACRKEYPNDTVIETIAKEITDYIVINGYSKEKRRKLPQKEYDPNIRKTLSYMFVNFNNPDLNLTKLAFHCGYSVAYFSRVFKKYVGDSPITHLNKIRISEARSLFANPNLSLYDISVLVGFKNLSTFTESFKKITGEKPKEYRTKLLRF